MAKTLYTGNGYLPDEEKFCWHCCKKTKHYHEVKLAGLFQFWVCTLCGCRKHVSLWDICK